MTTALEDRLSAALQARADLVQPEDLRHLSVTPPAPTPLWRRPAVIALVAAAAAAVIAVPVVLESRHSSDHPLPSHHPLPPNHVPSTRFPAPIPSTTRALSGDVDGDGQADQLAVADRTITVTLAADPAHPLTWHDQYLQGLAGLVDNGGPARGIVEVTHDLVNGNSWYILVVRNGALKLVPQGVRLPAPAPPGAGQLGTAAGYTTSWFTPAGVLMAGALDPMQQGQRHLAVYATSMVARSGRLHATPVGRLCWDVVTQQVPGPCPAGVDDAFDPGPHGSLPPLTPRSDLNDSIGMFDTWHHGSTSLHFVENAVHASSNQKQIYDVVGTIDGHAVRAPAGAWQVGLMKRYVDLGHGVRGLAPFSLDARAGGWVWHLLPIVDGRLVPAEAPRDLYPGVSNVVQHGQGHAGSTWIDPEGHVLTTVSLGDQGYVELYEWQVTDASGTQLQAVDLGEVCMDAYWDTYGTCRS